MTLKELYNTGTDILKNASIQESSLDAWYLLEYVTGITRARYFVIHSSQYPQNFKKQYLQLIQKTCYTDSASASDRCSGVYGVGISCK